MTIGEFTACILLGYFALVMLWLYPKKKRLLRRLGDLSNEEVIRLAKAGDVEARALVRLSRWVLALGVAVLLPLSVLTSLAKFAK